jgi:POT family proton-dependent oligopeptide transporter
VAAPTATMGMAPASSDKSFFGHPRGLSTLFFSEMWERFSYYGMRGFLILYMTAPVELGGLGLATAAAAAIYGMYTSSVYLLSLPGGWIADRLIGQRKAVLYGGILIALGHFSLAFPAMPTFYLGLLLVVFGTGLLKPNISVIVGQLYGQKDIRRDSGFSIFYMGINLGAFIGPLITGLLAQDEGFRGWLAGMGMDPNSSWHWAFGAAGVGMTLGLIQYVLGSRHLGDAGLKPSPAASPEAFAQLKKTSTLVFSAVLVLLVVVGAALANGTISVSAEQVTDGYRYVLLAVVLGFFSWLFMAGDWTREERGRLWVITVMFVAAALFWSVFEQAGSTLNLFADRSTNNTLFGYAFPSSWFQSLNALFIVLFAPVFAWLWIKMGDRAPAAPTKFSFGLIGVGLGFVVLVPAAQLAGSGALVSPLWLTLTYLIHTWAELCLSPVGLSSMTKLAPTRIVSLMMGVWFLGASVGNYLGGEMAGLYESLPLQNLFGVVGLFGIVAGLIMLAFSGKLTKMMHGVK